MFKFSDSPCAKSGSTFWLLYSVKYLTASGAVPYYSPFSHAEACCVQLGLDAGVGFQTAARLGQARTNRTKRLVSGCRWHTQGTKPFTTWLEQYEKLFVT